MKTYTSHSLEETASLAKQWLEDISNTYEESNEALVVGLSGHLGAGKTAFVKCIAKSLGIEEEITSPTFVIMKIYATKHPRWTRLVHIDVYRLERPEELEALRFEKIASEPGNLIMVEWPENIKLGSLLQIEEIKAEIRDGVFCYLV